MIAHSRPTVDKEEINAVCAVLKGRLISEGSLTKKLEKRFSGYIGRRYTLATNSGTSALHLALLALKVKPKDEIIMPSFVCSAVLNAVKYVGAVPRIADINIEDFNISVRSVKINISRRTKAIIVPHMFGVAADMDALLSLDIPIVEDCALSLGTTYKNKMAGSFGAISVFSFYATKMMTTAEGGMLVTNESSIYSRALDLKDYDNKGDYKVRYNYKLSDFAAAMGLAQLNKLGAFISRRQKIASRYNIGLSDLNIQLPYPVDNKTHIYFRYVFRPARGADGVIHKLKRFGIEAKKPVYKPLHNYLGLQDKDFPVTKEVYKTAVSLPIYPALEDRQISFIIGKTRQIFSR